MLRKWMALMMTFFLMFSATALAEFSFIEDKIPDEPIETENDLVRIVATYDETTDSTRYAVQLKDGAQFPDGTAVTAQDVLFSLYVYLDPGYSAASPAVQLPIIGLTSYRAQVSAEHYAEALTAMEAIREAGPNHAWSADDGWTEAAQTAYWSLANAYESACEAEFPICAQHIVDACVSALTADAPGALGHTAEEIAADPELHVAYAMLEWGYAVCENETTIRASRSGTVWQVDGGFAPTLSDFVNELKLAYDGDLAACWAVEAPDDYMPALPNVPGEFVRAIYAGAPDSVTSIEGIRVLDDATLEIMLEGLDMRSAHALLGQPVLSLSDYGDAAQWSPSEGGYGHAFGSTADIEAAVANDSGAHTVALIEDEVFTFG